MAIPSSEFRRIEAISLSLSRVGTDERTKEVDMGNFFCMYWSNVSWFWYIHIQYIYIGAVLHRYTQSRHCVCVSVCVCCVRVCLCVFAIERKRCLLCVPETGEIRTDHLGLLVYRPSPKQKSPVTPHPELINLLIRRNTAQTKSTETNFLLRNHRESNASPRHCEYLTFFVIFFHTIRYLLTCFFIGVNTRFSHPPGLRSQTTEF